MTRKQLRRAAFYLRDYARILRDSNVHRAGEFKGRFGPEDAGLEREYREMLELAAEMHALARDPGFQSVW